MKKSRNMSSLSRATFGPRVPTLPIEVWFEIHLLFKWEARQEGDDCLFYASALLPLLTEDADGLLGFPDERVKECKGLEYVDGLLKIRKPEELVSFMNLHGSPVEFGGRLRWSEFEALQAKFKQAMGLPIPKLRRLAQFSSELSLERFQVDVERRNGAYYGTVTLELSVGSCYRVIAVERLLGDVHYGFCLRCGNPFQITSGHRRMYCDPATCGHAVAQARYRLTHNIG